MHSEMTATPGWWPNGAAIRGVSAGAGIEAAVQHIDRAAQVRPHRRSRPPSSPVHPAGSHSPYNALAVPVNIEYLIYEEFISMAGTRPGMSAPAIKDCVDAAAGVSKEQLACKERLGPAQMRGAFFCDLAVQGKRRDGPARCGRPTVSRPFPVLSN
jgi:hypothetical protein